MSPGAGIRGPGSGTWLVRTARLRSWMADPGPETIINLL